MTTDQKSFVKAVLGHADKFCVTTALSYVNLGDEEMDVLVYRYMRKHTQEQSAEHFDCSVNHIQDVQEVALEKCYKVWRKNEFVKYFVNR